MSIEPILGSARNDAANGSVDLGALRVAIVHHWFVDPWCGAEKVVEAIARIFPQADLFGLMADPAVLPPDLQRRRLTTSFLQRFPGKYRWRRHLMPLYPLALEQLDLSGYDLVISSESGPAKGVITSPHTLHICYCHSPMRYIWDMYHEYKRGLRGAVARAVFSWTAHRMRLWDLATSSRVDHFIANSQYVARRIQKHYRRPATVIHPPIRHCEGHLSETVGDAYLVVGRLVDYKRVDLAIEACNRLKRPLKVIGEGPHYNGLRRMAGPTVEFLGFGSTQLVQQAYARCRALLFPGEEDFGLVPVEAQALGRPVIAYGAGGALETVKGLCPGDAFDYSATGVFFREQSPESLMEAIQYFEAVESRFSRQAIREHSAVFDEANFRAAFESFVASRWAEFADANSRLAGRIQVATAQPT